MITGSKNLQLLLTRQVLFSSRFSEAFGFVCVGSFKVSLEVQSSFREERNMTPVASLCDFMLESGRNWWGGWSL